jgi:hypothetical protein
MPTRSDHAAAADTLNQAFSVNPIVEAESQLYEEGFDSEDFISNLGKLAELPLFL